MIAGRTEAEQVRRHAELRKVTYINRGVWEDVRIVDIVHLRAAIEREQACLDEMVAKYSPPDHCCPSCACPGYSERVNKQGRRVKWLAQLLQKDGRPDEAETLLRRWKMGVGVP